MSQDLLSSDELQEALQRAFPPVPSEAWQRKIEQDLGSAAAMERLQWSTPDGLDLAPFYRAEDLEALPSGFLEAVRPAKTTGNDWHIRQDFVIQDTREANQQAQDALAQGATALGFAVDTDALVLERLLEEIPLHTPLHWAPSGSPSSLLRALLQEAARRNTSPASLCGSIASDPSTQLARTGTLDINRAFAAAAEGLHQVEAVGATLYTLRADAQPFHEAGASAVQEVAFVLASASEYLARLTDQGISSAQVLRHLTVAIPIGTQYFVEIGKLRALRLLFAQLAQAYGVQEDAPRSPHIEAVTSRWSLTRYDLHSNLLRATTQAAAALVGGCDTLTIRPFDAASSTPSPEALRLARTIQLILKHEAHLDAVTDPAAGSYYLETLTDQLARRAWSLFQQVEAQGGLFEAYQTGFIQQEIQTVRDQREHNIATGKRVVVGTNAYPDLDEALVAPEAPTDAGWASGEAALLPRHRGTEAYERLRLRTERHAQQTGRRPEVFLLPIGPPAAANARATFARNTFGCAGFSLLENKPYSSLEEGAKAALESRAELVVLCSADPNYATYAPALSDLLDAASKRPLLVVAGYPEGLVDALTLAGVDAFIHRNQNQLETLEQFQHRLGMH